jgi:hypothetical protein
VFGQTQNAYGKVYDIAVSSLTNSSGSVVTLRDARVAVQGPIRVIATFVVFKQAGYSSAGGGVAAAPFPLANGKPAKLTPLLTHPKLPPRTLVYLVVRAELTSKSGAGDVNGVNISYEVANQAGSIFVKVPYSLCSGSAKATVCKRSLSAVAKSANNHS